MTNGSDVCFSLIYSNHCSARIKSQPRRNGRGSCHFAIKLIFSTKDGFDTVFVVVQTGRVMD